MAKRFECPRCGSGVKPDDTQCPRCGESLAEAPKLQPVAPQAAPAPSVDKITRSVVTEITINPGTQDITAMNFSQNSLRFKCQRCAVFCCKCGGPRLSLKDVKNLERSGKISDLFVDSKDLTLKNAKDGSCLLLTVNTHKQKYHCSVYNLRPTLCRLYPFRFERLGQHSFELKLIPCCNGLNVDGGEIVDESFFRKYLREPFLDLLNHNGV
jgi:Fe-S-cluster containining protein